MKAIPFKIVKSEEDSLFVQIDAGPGFYDKLHYHPEWQITAIKRGEGILFVGNSFIEFQAGDIFFIGSNTPHLIRNNGQNGDQSNADVRAISLFFHKQSFGDSFFELPQMKSIRQLLNESQRGIKFYGKSNVELFQLMCLCEYRKDVDLFETFFGILNKMIKTKTLKLINETPAKIKLEEIHGQRMNAVFSYTLQGLSGHLSIKEVAKKANLSVSQFSRFFKIHTRKTYIQFVNELRVETACSMLRSSHQPIARIASDVGFKNLSNFNRQFRKIKKISPSKFRKIWA